MLRLFAAIALSLATICTVGGAAQIRYRPDAPGTWKPFVFHAYDDNRRRVAARPADVAALEKQLVALAADPQAELHRVPHAANAAARGRLYRQSKTPRRPGSRGDPGLAPIIRP